MCSLMWVPVYCVLFFSSGRDAVVGVRFSWRSAGCDETRVVRFFKDGEGEGVL